ncbi:MAG: ATP-binding protein [Lachnospiraceae bacterium]|nr:ATP-binding protein [Lachnospiraceae bacterium]
MTDALLLPAPPGNERILELTIGSTMSDTSEASERFLGFFRENGIPDAIGNKMWLTVQEICSNTTMYAYVDKTDYADLFLKITDKEVIMRIRDKGIIFEHTSFIDDSGKEITGLCLLRLMNINIEYNRVLGFNDTIVTKPGKNI